MWAEMYLCPICYSLTPDYGTVLSKEQADADMIASFPTQDWVKNRDALMGLVKFYEGEINRNELVGEVGGGPGCLASALINSGYDYIGSEPTPLCERAKKVFGIPDNRYMQTDYNGFFMMTEGQKFGTIFMWHVLEHVQDPMELLTKTYDSLLPGGKIIAEIPLPIPAYIFPDHLSFFSKPTLLYIKSTIGFSEHITREVKDWNYMSFIMRK
jgi:SAM-dependent methyltransferase